MRSTLFVALMAACLGVASAQQPLTNQDVIRMEKAGMSDPVILAAIKTQPHNFTLSTGDLIALKQAGVSDAVLATMLGSGAPAPAKGTPIQLKDVRAIYIEPNNNEVTSDVLKNLKWFRVNLGGVHQIHVPSCYSFVGSREAADASLTFTQVFATAQRFNTRDTNATAQLVDKSGNVLWQNSKGGSSGFAHDGAGDAAQALINDFNKSCKANHKLVGTGKNARFEN